MMGEIGCGVLGDFTSRHDEAKLRKQIVVAIDLVGSKVREANETGDPAIYKKDIDVVLFRNDDLSVATPTALNSYLLGYQLKDNMAVSPIESDATRMIVVATGDIKHNGSYIIHQSNETYKNISNRIGVHLMVYSPLSDPMSKFIFNNVEITLLDILRG